MSLHSFPDKSGMEIKYCWVWIMTLMNRNKGHFPMGHGILPWYLRRLLWNFNSAVTIMNAVLVWRWIRHSTAKLSLIIPFRGLGCPIDMFVVTIINSAHQQSLDANFYFVCWWWVADLVWLILLNASGLFPNDSSELMSNLWGSWRYDAREWVWKGRPPLKHNVDAHKRPHGTNRWRVSRCRSMRTQKHTCGVFIAEPGRQSSLHQCWSPVSRRERGCQMFTAWVMGS